MCPQNVFPLLRLVKTITAICSAWSSDILLSIFVALFGHLGRPDFGQILFICAQKVQLFLFFEGNVPRKWFPAASPCEEDHGNMLFMAIWNNFNFISDLDWSFTAAGFRTHFIHLCPKSAIISIFWRQCAPKMISRCFALWRWSRQYAFHGYLKFLAIFVALFRHLGPPDSGQILLFLAQKVRLFLYFERNVPPKYFPLLRHEKTITALCFHGYLNFFSYFCCIVSSFRAAGFRTNFTLFGPKSAIISLFWPQCAPKTFPRCFALRRRTRQYALLGYLK